MTDVRLLETCDHGAVRELRLARPPVNALDAALVRELRAALAAAQEAGSSARALVLSGQPGMFSAGLDVRALAALDPSAMRAFLVDFTALQRELATSQLPVVAAITGHCPAGGTVLALFCDYRVMARGRYSIGLNEVQVGLYPGEVIMRAFERLVGPRRCADLLSRGALLDPEAALASGLVDELTEVGDVRARALAYAVDLLALPPNAYARTRALVRRDLVALFDGSRENLIDSFAEIFFSAETRSRMQALLAKGGADRR